MNNTFNSLCVGVNFNKKRLSESNIPLPKVFYFTFFYFFIVFIFLYFFIIFNLKLIFFLRNKKLK